MGDEVIDFSAKISELAALNSSPSDQISALLALKLNAPHKSPEFESSLVSFATENGVDLVTAALTSVRDGQDVFRVAHLLRDSLHRFPKLNAHNLVDLLAAFAEKMENDLAGGIFYDSVRNLAKTDRNVAEEIAREILERKNGKIYGYLTATYLGLVDAEFQHGYKNICALCTSEDVILKGLGVRVLGNIPVIPEALKEEVLQTIRKAVSHHEELIAANAVFSLCRLFERYPELENEVISSSRLAYPMAQFEIACFLSSKQGVFEEWARQCFMSISGYNLAYAGITERVDLILCSLVSKKDPQLVRDFLSSWISSHSPEDHRDHKIDELFDSAIHAISQNGPLVNDLAFEWINSDDLRFHHCLSELLNYMQPRGITAPIFTKEHLQNLEFDDFRYIARKIIGYVVDFDYSASLAFSLLKQEPCDAKTAALMRSVFIDHIGYNYPHKAVEFLKRQLTADGLNQSERTVAETATKVLEEQLSQLQSLKPIPELFPPADVQVKLDREFRKSVSESMKSARKNSIVDMVKKVFIKEGRGSFSYYGGTYSDVSMMSHYSHSIEVARIDVLDVVGASIQRNGFRKARRGEA